MFIFINLLTAAAVAVAWAEKFVKFRMVVADGNGANPNGANQNEANERRITISSYRGDGGATVPVLTVPVERTKTKFKVFGDGSIKVAGPPQLVNDVADVPPIFAGLVEVAKPEDAKIEAVPLVRQKLRSFSALFSDEARRSLGAIYKLTLTSSVDSQTECPRQDGPGAGETPEPISVGCRPGGREVLLGYYNAERYVDTSQSKNVRFLHLVMALADDDILIQTKSIPKPKRGEANNPVYCGSLTDECTRKLGKVEFSQSQVVAFHGGKSAECHFVKNQKALKKEWNATKTIAIVQIPKDEEVFKHCQA